MEIQRTIPIIRSFDEDKAREFYIDYLGFSVDFEHRFAPDMPLYMGISRGQMSLHVSEHHGDASPGSAVYIECTGLREFHAELSAKGYRSLRPGIGDTPWGTLCVDLKDPFGNRLSFNERKS